MVDENYETSSVQLRQETKVLKNFQLELAGMASANRVDQKLHRWDVIKICEIHNGVEVAKYVYEANAIDSGRHEYMIGAEAKQRLEELQMELYAGRR